VSPLEQNRLFFIFDGVLARWVDNVKHFLDSVHVA
jgi:hypothetical protein